MKQIYLLLAVATGMVVCGCNALSSKNDRGEVIGVNGRAFHTTVPANMVYVPSGSFLMGETDQDITFSQIAQTKQVTIPAFFMDATEISNSQYRQFTNWVRDSIAITNYNPDPKYFTAPGKGQPADPNFKKYTNWDAVRKNPIWSTKGKVNNSAKLQGMYYQGDDRIFDRNELDVRLLKYSYEVVDYHRAANTENVKGKKRSDDIYRDTVPVYPDTLVWLKDFS